MLLMVGASLAFARKRSLAERGNNLRQHRGASKDHPNTAPPGQCHTLHA